MPAFTVDSPIQKINSSASTVGKSSNEVYLRMSEYLNKILCGDALQILVTLPAEFVDLVATDPPYGLEFMGKD